VEEQREQCTDTLSLSHSGRAGNAEMEDMAAKNFARFSALFGQETGSANDALLGWLLLPSAASSAASHPNPEPRTPHPTPHT